MRRFLTFCVVVITTTTASLYWLHDGDLEQAIEPVLAEWDADLLAQDAGIDAEDPSR